MTLDMTSLADLSRESGFPRATLCWSLGAPGDAMNKTRISLKNALDALDAELDARGVPQDQAKAIRAPLADWADGHTLDARGAVAAFLTPESARIETLPSVRREGAWVGESFRLAPVWPDPAERYDAAALVATEDSAKLLRLGRDGFGGMKADLPDSLQTFLGPKEIEPQRSMFGASDKGTRGHSISDTHKQEKREELERYANALAHGAADALHDTGLPLVIVADEKLAGLIRAHCGYMHLAEEPVTRHPSSMDEAEMAEAVRAASAAQARAALKADRARVEEALGRGDPSSEDPVEIVAAAGEGRIQILLFDPSETLPGRLEGGVQEDAEGPDDLVDAALRTALANGASVRADPGAPRPLRALLRW